MNKSLLIIPLIYSFSHLLLAEESTSPSSDNNEETNSAVELAPLEVIGTETEDMGYIVPNATSGTKTDTPIMEIPQSIQVIPKAILSDQDSQTLSNALENVSSVVAPKSTELLTSGFIVRGFKSKVYLDNMPTSGAVNAADSLSLINVEKIEVAKGPTATLFGGGLGAPVGGLINVVSKQPHAENKYTVSFRGGSFSTINPSFDFNQSLSEDDKVLFRLTGEYQQAESFIDEVESEQYSIYPTLSVDFSEDTRLVIQGQYSHINFLEYTGLRAEGTIEETDYNIPRFRYSGATDTPKSEVENKMLTLNFSHRFSEHFKASIQARYYKNEFEEFSSFHHGSLSGLRRPRDLKDSELPFYSGVLNSTTEALIINPNFIFDFNTGFIKHKVLLGAEYDTTRSNAQLGTYYDTFEDIYLDLADREDDINYLEVVEGNLTQAQENRYQTMGVYLQDQLDIGDRLHLLASLRWTTISVEEIEQTTRNSSLTPRIGVVFDLTDSVSAFVGYGEGFRAVLAMFGETAKPEESTQIEAGIKFDAIEYGLSGTISGYELIRNNVVVPDPNGAFSSIQAGEQTAIGAEIDILWEPTEALSILANYAYTDARLTKHADPKLVVDDKLPRIPQHSGRAAIRYRFQKNLLSGLEVGMGVSFSSSRHISLPNTFKTDGFYRLDAQVSYPLTKNLKLSVNVQNLTNSQYYEPFLFLQDEVVSPGQPISAFATLRASF